MGQIIRISSLDDPRIAAYTRLKERDLAHEGRRFIAEAELVVRRMLASDCRAESVLVAEDRLEKLAPIVPADVPVYVAPHEVVNHIVGYKFHSGVMAVGIRPAPRRLADMGDLLGRPRVTLVICPEISNTDNMGSLIRIASGFGVDAMVLGERCCNPFYRQSVRVSIGAIFGMPLIESENLLEDLGTLRRQYGVELIATVLHDDARPLSEFQRSDRIGILLGNEVTGLRAEETAACDHRVTIPMRRGTDSLNVSVAAGVFLYELTK